MDFFYTILLLFVLICGIFFLLRTQRTATAKTDTNCLEYRTDRPLDECIDLLRAAQESDLFTYTIAREADGSFSLHLTQHNPTSQPIDTLFSLRLESGRQTVITLMFLREAFGYKEPVFPLEILDAFLEAKLDAHRQQQ